MLPPLPLGGIREAASASSWHSARPTTGRSFSDRGQSDPGVLMEHAGRLAAIREAEKDEQAARQKALAKQAAELSQAAALGAAGRWRSPRVEVPGAKDALSNIADLRKAMQDLRRECLDARALSPMLVPSQPADVYKGRELAN
ncbi:unnamed protein product [Effrenium voratum]|uniref:Uncharacterized protein n=1 Tax=Effrenium voratum TaxID=2562239 RepID=A0AA36HRA8_9DINO|nr:unnamed protein product [Effrenium voratum]CAJ1424382.1 unnamed protein product [Effrenium voratum]